MFRARESIGTGHRSLDARTRVCVADWNRDGQPDVILHHNEERGLLVAEGPVGGKAELEFSKRIAGSESIRVIFTQPLVTDWNRDGALDLLVAMREPNGQGIYLLRGIRTADATRLATPELLVAPPHGGEFSGMNVTDWDKDGVDDLVLGVTWWNVDTFRRRSFKHSEIWVYRSAPPQRQPSDDRAR